MAGAPNDGSYKSNTYILGISIYYFQNVCEMVFPGPKVLLFCLKSVPWIHVSIVDIEEILLFNVVGPMLRTGFEAVVTNKYY